MLRCRPSYFLTALLSVLVCYSILMYFENSVATGVREQKQDHNSEVFMPTLYVITPTYSRKTQIADLVRLKQTLKLVPKCEWIVVEDANRTNPLVYRYIQDYPRLIYIHEESQKSEVTRGTEQRNRAILEIQRLKLDTNGALYFADDDNTYDALFLDEIRWVKTVGVFNVGLIAGLPFEGPMVSEEGIVIGWKTGWKGDRQFCIDMAGIVINLQFFLTRSISIHQILFQHTRKGHLENQFLENLGVEVSQLEVFTGPNFVHVWHTQTHQPETTGTLKAFPHYPHKPLFYSERRNRKRGLSLKRTRSNS